MSKPERVFAALRGQEVDRVPVSAWWHDFPREWSPEGLAEATLEAYRDYDWDFIKVNPRATYYGEAWAARYQQSDQPQQPRLIEPGATSGEALRRVQRVSVADGPLGEQLAALAIIGRRLDGEAPYLQTVFSPLASMSRVAGSTRVVQGLMREAPDDLLAALGPIADTLREYAAACLDHGAAGVFFATVEWGSADVISAEDYDRFARPFDLRVLEAVVEAPFNVLHVCRDNNHLERLLDYPVAAFQWASRSRTNPSVSDILPRTEKALMGGVDQERTMRDGSPADVAAEARGALDVTGGRRFLLTPECSIDPQTPAENLRSLVEAARA